MKAPSTDVFVTMAARRIIAARQKRERFDHFQSLADHALNGWTAEQLDRENEAALFDWERERQATQRRDTFTFADLSKTYPEQKPVLVDGLARNCDLINIVASSKIGKSWFIYNWALCQIIGRYLLGKFKCTPGRVLIVDNELDPATIASRIAYVASAMGVEHHEYADKLFVKTLRGHLRPFDEVADEIHRDFTPGELSLIFWDAKYRFARPGQSENDNASEAQFYNDADRFAVAIQAGMGFVHHSTKGSQGERRVSDVGAGAGAQSRAADVHAVFREHQDDGAFVFEALVRTFAPVEPVGVRWQFPLWVPDHDVDPGKLKGKQTRSDERQAERDREAINQIVDSLRKDGPGTARKLRERTGIGADRMERLIGTLYSDEQIVATPVIVKGNSTSEYSLPKSGN